MTREAFKYLWAVVDTNIYEYQGSFIKCFGIYRLKGIKVH